MDRPRPSLGSVPPRPERPPPEARDAISAALALNRTQSREPLALRTVPAPPAAGVAPGEPSLPAAPPPRAALTSAPAIPGPVRATPPRPRAAAAPPRRPSPPRRPPCRTSPRPRRRPTCWVRRPHPDLSLAPRGLLRYTGAPGRLLARGNPIGPSR
ncbi:hypothetical protein ACFQY5_29855 [Paeniroseomonas aquatica]|uniref:hypothetical protein n=1 Tax=Paeniroseomonas aquatica TaxID=373043 RepID=UPI00361D1641